MNFKLYNPFKNSDFNYDVCFLTGQEITKDNNRINVFPEWIMKRYSLHEKPFTMLAENKVNYEALILPVSSSAYDIINNLEIQIEKAFTLGYEAVIKLDQLKIFQWLALRVYGILYNDIAYAHSKNMDGNSNYQLSEYYINKISFLHAVLQSLYIPIDLKTDIWSIVIEKVKYSKDIFNYKDETKKLSASLAMNDFGIIACLQDNGQNIKYNETVVNNLSGVKLHPIQFEELWCRFLYSNYLLRNSSGFKVEEKEDKIVVTNIEENQSFGEWDDKIFSQVLANYWKPWGLTTQDIYQYPGTNISYLVDELTGNVFDPEKISLPW